MDRSGWLSNTFSLELHAIHCSVIFTSLRLFILHLDCIKIFFVTGTMPLMPFSPYSWIDCNNLFMIRRGRLAYKLEAVHSSVITPHFNSLNPGTKRKNVMSSRAHHHASPSSPIPFEFQIFLVTPIGVPAKSPSESISGCIVFPFILSFALWILKPHLCPTNERIFDFIRVCPLSPRTRFWICFSSLNDWFLC